MGEKFVSKAVDEKGDGLDVYRVVRVGNGGTSGMVTDDSEMFRLDNLDSEVVGGACGGPDSLCPFSLQIKSRHFPTSQSTF
jgi:hypothetical protein